MTKKKVAILIVLMAISMVGIIGLQLAWVSNALEVRNELFDRSVREALVATTYRAERFSDAFWLQNEFGPFKHDSYPNRRPRNGRRNRQSPPDSIQNPWRMQENNRPQRNGFNPFNDSTRMTPNGFNFKDIEKEIDRRAKAFEEMRQGSSTDSISANNDNDTVPYYANRADKLKSVAGQMAFEGWGFGMKIVPDTAMINWILSEELAYRGISILGYTGFFTDSLGLIKSPLADSVSLANSKYSTILYPSSFFNRNERITVYFPDREMFIFKKLIWTASLSLVFCLFILAIFSLSIHYIVSQKKISEMKSDFINNMTHEFKTPLATISVAADSILNAKIIANPEKIKHFVQAIKKENLRMNHQVETILQIARLDKKEFEFSFKTCNMHELIDKAVQSITLQVESRYGSIVAKLDAQNPIITADAVHVTNMLNNLLDNANKYSPEKPEITISTRNVSTGIWVSVSDKGIGMNKQVQQRIFEKFYRETSGNIHNVKGFGLGLSYSKAVVDAHKGKITVHSDYGKGSTFEVFLPFAVENSDN